MYNDDIDDNEQQSDTTGDSHKCKVFFLYTTLHEIYTRFTLRGAFVCLDNSRIYSYIAGAWITKKNRKARSDILIYSHGFYYSSNPGSLISLLLSGQYSVLHSPIEYVLEFISIYRRYVYNNKRQKIICIIYMIRYMRATNVLRH